MASITLSGGSRQQRAFRDARRHSRNVRFLRMVMPASFGLVAIVFVANILLNTRTDFGDISFESLSITDGALVMEGPRLKGIDRNERAYTLAAEQASQKIGQDDIVDLVGIDATMAVDPQTNARILSRKGRFNQKNETIYLYDGVDVATNSGYRVSLTDADVDLNEGVVESDQPLTVEMLNGTLRAKGVEIANRGEVVTFKGRVDMRLRLHGKDEP